MFADAQGVRGRNVVGVAAAYVWCVMVYGRDCAAQTLGNLSRGQTRREQRAHFIGSWYAAIISADRLIIHFLWFCGNMKTVEQKNDDGLSGADRQRPQKKCNVPPQSRTLVEMLVFFRFFGRDFFDRGSCPQNELYKMLIWYKSRGHITQKWV